MAYSQKKMSEDNNQLVSINNDFRFSLEKKPNNPFLSTEQFDFNRIPNGDRSDRKNRRKQRRKFENDLDKQHGGIGVSAYVPNFGKNIKSGVWMEASLLTDLLELRLGYGKINVIGYGKKRTAEYQNLPLNDSMYGVNMYIGGSLPLKFLDFGYQKSWINVFRGHPIIDFGVGYRGFSSYKDYRKLATNHLIYAGVAPGYRIRFPLGSLDLKFNMEFTYGSGISKDYFGWFTFFPSLTLRLDALKMYYNPKSVTIHGTQTSVKNYKSTSYYVGNYRYTYSTYDLVTTPISMGISDIGVHIGIGPKISFMAPRNEQYIPTSIMLGVVAQGRAAFLDFGLTLEGGKIGHGGKLKSKSKDKAPFYKRVLDKSFQDGQGTMNTFNFYSQIGFDLTSTIASLGGISISKGGATSFFSFSAGVNVGGHYTWNQKFIDPNDAAIYDQRIIENNGKAREKYVDPRQVGIGYLGGWYINAEIGALSFKFTNLRYFGAPFASSNTLSIAYRFPIYRRYKH